MLTCCTQLLAICRGIGSTKILKFPDINAPNQNLHILLRILLLLFYA